MQSWSLERKIRVTQLRIMEWYERWNGQVFLSFSGGKDSTVLLDLARRIYPHIPAVFVDTGLEYPEIRAFVKTIPDVVWLKPERQFRDVITEYGYPVISKEVAQRIHYAQRGSEWALMHLKGLNSDGSYSKFNQRYVKYAYLLDAPFQVSSKCCDIIKKRPLALYQKQTKAVPIIGTMACESVRRQSAFLHTGCNAFEKTKPTSQPLSFWTEQDILQYLKLTGLPYASIYGDLISQGDKIINTGVHRTGCMFCMFGAHLEKEPNRFQRMAITHPKQYHYCLGPLGCAQVLDYIKVPYQ